MPTGHTTSTGTRPVSQEEDQLAPVFILGAPRSGTSLLYRVLALHPRAAWINNYQRRAPGFTPLAAIGRLSSAAANTRRTVWFGSDGDNAYRYNAQRSLLERFFPQPVEGEPLFRHRGIPEDGGVGPATAEQLRIRDDFAAILRYSGADVLLSKRIGHNLRIPLLHDIFPAARFLVLTRDGRAVSSSLLRVDWWPENYLWWFGSTVAEAVAQGADPLTLSATHWAREVDAIDSGLAGVPESQILHLRYEELVQDPNGELKAARSFAGLPDDHRWSTALRGLQFPNKNSNWEAQFAGRASEVTALQRDQLIKHGYPA